MSVASHDDYDNLMTGLYLPKGVGVKRFIPPRSRFGTQVWGSKDSVPSFMNNPSDHVTTHRVIQDFYQASDDERSQLTVPQSAAAISKSPPANDVSNNIIITKSSDAAAASTTAYNG